MSRPPIDNRYNRHMSLTLLAPVALDLSIVEMTRHGTQAPHLERLLATAQMSRLEATPERWLCAQLGIAVGAEPPVAALRLAAEAAPAPDPREGYWLCADPVVTTLGIDMVRIDGMATDLTSIVAEAMIRDLNAVLAAEGVELFAPHPSRWYVRAAGVQQLTTTALWRAIGGSMLSALPRGADGPAWRTRLNEAQMLLHSHPANAVDESGGQRPAGSVWWWGGGAWPEFGPPIVDMVHGGPAWLRSACIANDIPFDRPPAETARHFRTDSPRTLFVLEDDWETAAATPDVLTRWDTRWFAPLSAALDSGAVAGATLLFPWDDGLLQCELRRMPQAPAWRRWLGIDRPAAVPPLVATLEAFLR
ncbi:MAG: hypothetical protein ABI831_22865 [Betaproteobacteria bacterium]